MSIPTQIPNDYPGELNWGAALVIGEDWACDFKHGLVKDAAGTDSYLVLPAGLVDLTHPVKDPDVLGFFMIGRAADAAATVFVRGDFAGLAYLEFGMTADYAFYAKWNNDADTLDTLQSPDSFLDEGDDNLFWAFVQFDFVSLDWGVEAMNQIGIIYREDSQHAGAISQAGESLYALWDGEQSGRLLLVAWDADWIGL